MFPFTEMYLKYVHLSDSFNHSLPEMMYLWWLQVVWCVATLLHHWKWCFNLFSANHELNIPWIYVVYAMNVCWFLSWIQFGYVSGWGVLFGPQNITLKSKKGHLILRHPYTHIYIYIWDICVKNHVLQQWIASWGAKPTQDKTTVHNT